MTPRTGDSLRVDTTGALGTPSRALRWSDAQARVLWSSGRVAVDGRLGLRPRLDSALSTLWGRATATVAVAPRLSLVGSFGTEASRAWLGMPASRFASLGLRVAPASLSRPAPPARVRPQAASFALRPDDSGGYVVTMHVPGARSVELSGDFNRWRPIALREVRPDVWEMALALAPGTYHVNVRVNGDAWTAPPGLAATNDEFNGTVGLLVVR